ncbi:MAG: SLBB domain-containing protein [Mariprofundus sp.]|nr:SLBB domain-containing protein [Mariprofundus sp.]
MAVSLTMLAGLASADADYRLGVGDRISIHVFEEDMDVEAKLGASGSFRFPYLGTITAKGKSIGQLEGEIERGLRDGYLVNPQVRIRIEEFRSYYVNGEVSSPGGFPYQLGLTLRKAIALAGGFSEKADEDKVYVIREKDTNRRKHKISMDSALYPGDIVSVEQSFFFINGQVASPGKYSYQSGMTFRMAVSLAGGFTERASESGVIVLHEHSKNKKPKNVRLDSAVRAGDIITVNQSFF